LSLNFDIYYSVLVTIWLCGLVMGVIMFRHVYFTMLISSWSCWI